jgi:radical SAM superfamily enzyme YgiQ (UPF0313 family)
MNTEYADLRVTLVQMPRWSIRTPPYTIALLTGILREEGFTVFPKDYDIDLYGHVDEEDKQHWIEENSGGWNDPALYERMIEQYPAFFDRAADDILSDDPQVVGFSVKMWSAAFSLEVARRIKEKKEGVFIIFGGPQMNSGPERNLAPHPQVDAICRQEADHSLPAFLKKFAERSLRPAPEPGFAYRDENGTIVDCGLISEPPRPEDIPFADYSDFDFSRYTDPSQVTMILSRGCVFRCSFCAESPCYMKFRSYSADRIMKELDHVLAGSNPAKPVKISFNDSLLNGDLKALEAFCDQLIRRASTRIRWGGMMALRRQMSDDLIGKLAEAGCEKVFFGMESASPKVLKMMRKTHDPETASRIIGAMHGQGIEITLSIIVGHPGETEKEFYETLDFLRRHARTVDHIMLHALVLCAGSAIADRPEKYGVDPRTISGDECDAWMSDNGTNTPDIRLHRLHIAQHMLSGKTIDYGGATDRDAEMYNPMAQLEAGHAERIISMFRLVKNVRIEHIDEASGDKNGHVDECAVRHDPTGLVIGGWARDARSGSPAESVIIINEQDEIVEHAVVNRPRSDVADALGNPSDRGYGWKLEIHAGDLSILRGRYRICVYLPDENKAIVLGGSEKLNALIDEIQAR